MTIERAAEIVAYIKVFDPETRAIDLFTHFVEFFNLKDEAITEFARQCGFPIATKRQTGLIVPRTT